eukprot:CAMPEP_0204364648 /NCGR_PEP_ID=MMETSP0469-20131031/41307_1 /ASSEMBLY_ACC=CAM_ASM_000384 /TAXON_ID=2969 /ORGANISM="Oxyrrhis marina" /LENGTH=139 /DNA_ID=CAMNT_0051353593 /DNA_START=46 /DNA_END=462 /DNA_ORIENTATION=-
MSRGLLNKATASDDAPPPGYLFGEIARQTFNSPDESREIAEYLLKKLQKDQPNVKLKCLRVIKHVCEQGKPDFKREIQRRAEVVKACLQYRSTPDPLKGDQPSKAVRDEADAALKCIFDSNPQSTSMGPGNRIQGFGSE